MEHGDEDDLVFTPRYQQILGSASTIARMMGHGHVGAEHLLLAILHDPDSLPARHLGKFGDRKQMAHTLQEEMSAPEYLGTMQDSSTIPGTN
ncbi:Clp protease N-terminal domain-containing protein [Streptomyces sp. NPDC041068]|uniref:Clp protease N-terminal domain-containing protein n=1 Tax=Streptomyces sp. NPDC041068 TaxID=3155130 RepID=UPI0033F471F8